MNVVVTVILVGAIMSICISLVTSLFTMQSVTKKPEEPRRPIVIATGPIYWAFTIWTTLLGVFLTMAPEAWFGPSWFYFKIIPHGGLGMGVCLTILSAIQAVALWREMGARVLSVLFFLNGFVYWTAGIILGSEGFLGHQGLMEAPFMLWVGAQAFAHSSSLSVYAGLEQQKRDE